jgi:hypothetical protein
VLEQRIARVHRMGQERPVRVVNLVTRGTIEEKVLRTIEQKQELFAGLFDGEDDEIAFAAVNPGGFLNAVRDLIGEARAEVPPPAPAVATTPIPVAPPPALEESLALIESLADWIDTLAVQKQLTSEQRKRLAAAAEKLK